MMTADPPRNNAMQKGCITMVKSIISDMFNNTDNNGLLYINSWDIKPDEVSCIPRFFKCRMNWDIKKAQQIAAEAEELCDALEKLGRYFADNELDIYIRPDPALIGDEQEAEQLIDVWDTFFDGFIDGEYDEDELIELAQQRLGENAFSYNAFIRARYVVKSASFGALQFFIDKEKYEFVRIYALAHACDEFVCIDISKDRYNCRTHMFGGFNEYDISRVFEIIENDCTVMPSENMGYMLLVNKILCMQRLDIYRCIETLRPAIDAVLGTLTMLERDVLIKLYGLDGGVRISYDHTAIKTGTAVTMVKYYEADALEKMQNMTRQVMVNAMGCDEETDSGDTAEMEAFKADVEMAKYMARVEKGELTEEELENRKAMLDFINSPCDLPDDLFEKKD